MINVKIKNIIPHKMLLRILMLQSMAMSNNPPTNRRNVDTVIGIICRHSSSVMMIKTQSLEIE